MTPSRDFECEQRGVAIRMVAAMVTSIVVLAAAAVMDHAAPSAPFVDRLRVALRTDLIVVSWLAAAIANVARLRFFSARDIAGSATDHGSAEIAVAGALLQNTLEQVGLAIVAHLIVVATFDRSDTIIGALAGLFAVGRFLFWRGYRRGARARAFGFALTFYPTILVLLASATAIGWRWIA